MTDLLNMNRRALLERALLLVGVAAIPAGCSGLTGGPEKRDFKFDAEQLALVSAIADTIVPKGDTVGALDVKVPQSFESLLSYWASDERLEEILTGLKNVDAAAMKAKSKPFAALDPATRLELLNAHDVESLKPDPNKKPKEGILAIMTGPALVDEGYAKMRELMIALFYYSEPALTQELEYEHDPGGWTPSVPITPETRASGGLGLF